MRIYSRLLWDVSLVFLHEEVTFSLLTFDCLSVILVREPSVVTDRTSNKFDRDESGEGDGQA